MDPISIGIGFAAVVLFLVFIKEILGIVRIKEDEVGCIVKKFSTTGASLPNGRIVALNGEAGYQAKTLSPGIHFFYWRLMFEIQRQKVVVIKPGHIGLVSAKDGAPLPAHRQLAKEVSCDLFQDAEAFLKNGGQKGKQSRVLTAGIYRINRVLFDIETREVTQIPSDKVGIVTTHDGNPLESGLMAAPVVSEHSSFQDPDRFIENGGRRGLQEQILLAGQYNLNPWFATVELSDLTSVPIGQVGVVVSYVGEEKVDISGEHFTHGNLVEKGGRGVWSEPLYPGKHPLNTRCMKVELVPTTNIVLNWAESRNESHQLDEDLSTITVRSRDGFAFNLDVSQIINIGAKQAPLVIMRVGSVRNLVDQVLEPLVGNYFRNSGQAHTVLEFLTDRKARQEEARDHISKAIEAYNVHSVDTLIGDINPPKELLEPLTQRKVAEELQKTYSVQMEAQATRKTLEAATALANKQNELVNEEQNIQIAERKAQAAIKQAEGDSAAAAKRAEGEAEAIRKRGQAEAEILAVKGKNEAEAIRAIGLAHAEAAEAGVKAMGDSYAMVQIFQKLAENKIKLVPDIATGAGGSASDALLAMLLTEKKSAAAAA